MQYLEITPGKTLDKHTGIIRIARYHRNFEKYTDGFQPVEKVKDEVLEVLRKRTAFCTNIMTVLDYNDDYIYARWIDGIPLINLTPVNSWMHQTTEKLNFTKIIKAVKYLHAAGLAHLDIRAKNILVTENAEPVIIDLLCAQFISQEFENRDMKDLNRLEKELLFSWYERITY